MDYNTILKEQFEDLAINLVKHDTSPTGYPCYIEAHLGKKPKDAGQTALDLSNYIYRTTGLKYQSVPEYRGKGKTTTIRWFMSWEDVEPILPNIYQACSSKIKKVVPSYLPLEFNSLIIQNTARGVLSKNSID